MKKSECRQFGIDLKICKLESLQSLFASGIITRNSAVSTDPNRMSSIRVKRFATKVRTGCLTCRKRRVKCDEGRPRCLRCTRGQRECKYVQPFHSGAVAVARADDSPHMVRDVSLYMTDGDQGYRQYLHIFQHLVVPWISPYSKLGLLKETLLQYSWNCSALRHAIAAVGIASEVHYTGAQSNALVRSAQDYNKAIQHLYADTPHADTMLATCLTLWLCDNIVGNTKSALVHLRGFLQLVIQSATNRQLSDVQLLLARCLFWFGIGMDKSLAECLFPDTLRNVVYRMQDKEYDKRMTNRENTAEDCTLCWAMYHLVLKNEIPGQNVEFYVFALSNAGLLLQFVEKWYHAARSFCSSLTLDDSISIDCHRDLLSLAICTRCDLLTGDGHAQSASVLLSSLDRVLDTIESISTHKLMQKPGQVDLIVPIIPLLTEIVSLTNDVTIQRRTLMILQRIRRVEGFWGSGVVASMLQYMISSGESDQHNLDADYIGATSETPPAL